MKVAQQETGICGPRVRLGLEMDDEPPAEQYDIPETIGCGVPQAWNAWSPRTMAQPIGVCISGPCFAERMSWPLIATKSGGLGHVTCVPIWDLES